MKSRRTRFAASPELNSKKVLLIASAYKRINRANRMGFYIEAIAIEESLICDRLEAILSRKSIQEVEISTIGKLVIKIRENEILDHDFCDELIIWQKNRSLIIHEMVKVTSEEPPAWSTRMQFAKKVSFEGLQLLNRLSNLEYRYSSSISEENN